YVRHEGCWLPKPLADGWSSSFADVRAQSLTWADGLSEHPEAWDSRLREIDQLLNELAEATSPDDIKQCWQRGMQRLILAMANGRPQQESSAAEKAATADASKSLRQPGTTETRRPTIPDTEELLPDQP